MLSCTARSSRIRRSCNHQLTLYLMLEEKSATHFSFDVEMAIPHFVGPHEAPASPLRQALASGLGTKQPIAMRRSISSTP